MDTLASTSESRGVAIVAVRGETPREGTDLLAVEEPLEIRLVYGPRSGRTQQAVAVTMRTPGQDADLAAGFLHGEGVVRDEEEIEGIVSCGANVIRVELRPGVTPHLPRLQRHVYTTSSCGVCGKASLEAVAASFPDVRLSAGPIIPAAVIHRLPERLRRSQVAFAQTGGLHAAALFDEQGDLQAVREDVGRHNAVDKLLGGAFREGRLPLTDQILFVSGRASFELVQKAVSAGVPIFAAVGAPSSLAVDLAQRYGLTLIGFVRDGRFNVYCGRDRLDL